LKLYAFGAAEVFDVISDWISILKMRKENEEDEDEDYGLEVKIYSLLGGCSLFVAFYALVQRAGIQQTINEQVRAWKGGN
jgi:hypothetical protein